MSENTGIEDEQLPEDLRPEDNPLAEGLEGGETVEGLLDEGKHADQSEESEQTGQTDPSQGDDSDTDG